MDTNHACLGKDALKRYGRREEENSGEDLQSPLRKTQKIVLIDKVELSGTILPEPASVSVQTPKSRSKPYRFPMPYNPKPSFRFQLAVKSETEADVCADKENTNGEVKNDDGHIIQNNFSTATTSKSVLTSSKGASVGDPSFFSTNNNDSSNRVPYEDKTAARRQRHMDMFKGRTTNPRVRGSRSNRRFGLELKQHHNLEHN